MKLTSYIIIGISAIGIVGGFIYLIEGKELYFSQWLLTLILNPEVAL